MTKVSLIGHRRRDRTAKKTAGGIRILRRSAVFGLLINSLLLALNVAAAQSWPTRPIKFVVPYGPGIGIDIIARMIADQLSRRLGQAVFVENQPGAGSMVGALSVARAEPDGYTFLFTGNSPLTSNIYLFKSLPYDPRKAFDAVAMIADRGPFIISANPNVPVGNLPELIAYAKIRPGQLNYAYDSSSAYNWVLGQYLNKRADIKLVPVPYRSTSQAFQDTLAGVTQLAVGSVAASAPFTQEGKLKRLAISSKGRFPGSEQLPTFEETLPGFRLEGFLPLMAPAGLPPEIAQRMNKEIDGVLKDQEILQRISLFGYATSGAETPDAVNQHLEADREMWATFAKELAIQPQ
jgi:tripartite-type tricarboxylate transporter receptor subunit TctC